MKRRRLWIAGAALLVVAGIVVLIVMSSSGSREADRLAVQRYFDTIRPHAVEGGRVVQQGIKPRITDLRDGSVTPEQFVREADGWKASFEKIRGEFRRAPRPERLARTARLYDESLGLYLQAIERFRDAAAKTGEARDAALSAGAEVAERADDAYDRARDELSKQMLEVGLEPPDSF